MMRRILIPFIQSEDIEDILKKIDNYDYKGGQFYLVRLIEEEAAMLVARSMGKDHNALISELEEEGWSALYFFQEEFKKKGINLRISLKIGNSVKDLIGAVKEYGIELVLFSRREADGMRMQAKEKVVEHLMMDSDAMIMII